MIGVDAISFLDGSTRGVRQNGGNQIQLGGTSGERSERWQHNDRPIPLFWLLPGAFYFRPGSNTTGAITDFLEFANFNVSRLRLEHQMDPLAV